MLKSFGGGGCCRTSIRCWRTSPTNLMDGKNQRRKEILVLTLLLKMKTHLM